MKIKEPRGWVFIDDETGEEVGYAEPKDYRNAEQAVDDFGRSYSDHFGVCFRDSNGELCPCDAEDTAENFV